MSKKFVVVAALWPLVCGAAYGISYLTSRFVFRAHDRLIEEFREQ